MWKRVKRAGDKTDILLLPADELSQLTSADPGEALPRQGGLEAETEHCHRRTHAGSGRAGCLSDHFGAALPRRSASIEQLHVADKERAVAEEQRKGARTCDPERLQATQTQRCGGDIWLDGVDELVGEHWGGEPFPHGVGKRRPEKHLQSHGRAEDLPGEEAAGSE